MQGALRCSRESPRTPRPPLFLAEHRLHIAQTLAIVVSRRFTDWGKQRNIGCSHTIRTTLRLNDPAEKRRIGGRHSLAGSEPNEGCGTR